MTLRKKFEEMIEDARVCEEHWDGENFVYIVNVPEQDILGLMQKAYKMGERSKS